MAGIQLTRNQRDRYTTSLENVFREVEGRNSFRNYMTECRFQNDVETLNLWEQAQNLFESRETPGGGSPARYNETVVELLSEADEIQGFGGRVMTALHELANNPNASKSEVNVVLEMVKRECTRLLNPKYQRYSEWLTAGWQEN